MHPISMKYGPRHAAVAVLAALFVLVAAVCWVGFRRSSRPWSFPVLGGYNLLLLALFMLGVARDDGYGGLSALYGRCSSLELPCSYGSPRTAELVGLRLITSSPHLRGETPRAFSALRALSRVAGISLCAASAASRSS